MQLIDIPSGLFFPLLDENPAHQQCGVVRG
jgi:hypothetical protein